MAFDLVQKEEPDLRTEAECFPDIDPGIDVAGDRVLVQLRREKTTSKGGIILVDETKATLRFNETVAKVKQIGSLAYKSPDTLEPWPEGPWCNVERSCEDDQVRRRPIRGQPGGRGRTGGVHHHTGARDHLQDPQL
jgi:hypothetical protein